MGTINSAFNLIAGALDADQSALNIVANNVANANTTGYTREAPNMQENAPVEINGMTYGAGVTETGPTSIRDRVLDQRLLQQQQLASAIGHAAHRSEHAAGVVHSRYRLNEFERGRHRQRHHQLLQFVLFARSESNRQRTSPTGAIDRIGSRGRCVKRGGKSNPQRQRWIRRQPAWPVR